MSSAIERAFCLGFGRCAWRRCAHAGAHDSESWPVLTAATASPFDPVPRACRAVLAVYEDDLARPRWAPHPHGYGMDPAALVKRASCSDTGDRCPPYIIYLDRPNKEVVLAVRGLNLARDGDYRVLFDNGIMSFDGGHVHRGLLKSAVWVLNREAATLAALLREPGREDYRLIFAGHSLGAGVAALMAVVAVNYVDTIGGVDRSRVRAYALAPPRCMTLDLAVKYADVVHSIVLQDDFMPRTAPPSEHIFASMFCVPCLMLLFCLRDTFALEEKTLKDPMRLYAPGRMYHIVYRKPCSCGTVPPEVRTAIPIEGRFEHVVLSCNAIFDHRIVWIEQEAQKALERMREGDGLTTTAPTKQKMEREPSLDPDIKDAMERSLLLDVPHVTAHEECSEENRPFPLDKISPSRDSISSSNKSEWDELVEVLLNEEESDELTCKDNARAIAKGYKLGEEAKLARGSGLPPEEGRDLSRTNKGHHEAGQV